MSAGPAWPDEEVIGAYVDGELGAEERDRFERSLTQDASLARRVAAERQLRATLAQALAPALAEPVPDALLRVLEPAPSAAPAAPAASAPSAVHADPQRAASAASPVKRVSVLPRLRSGVGTAPRWVPYALAACLALGLTLGMFLDRRGTGDFAPGAHGLLASGALARSLTHDLSGDRGPIRVAMSFADHDGALCRTFIIEGTSEGLACRRDDRWHIDFLQATSPAGQAPDYRPAASTLSPALLSAIESRRAGEPLDPAAEQRARARGWTPASQP